MTDEKNTQNDVNMDDNPPPYEPEEIPSEEDQLEEMKDCEIEHDKEYYLISRKWMEDYKNNLRMKNKKKIEPIDNSDMFYYDGEFKSNNMEGYDYFILSKEQWEKLVKWYGCKQEPVLRKSYEKTVVVYPFQAEVGYYPNGEEIKKSQKFSVPKQAPVRLLKDLACQYFQVPNDENARIVTKDTFDPLTEVDLTRKIDYAFYSYSKIFLQVKDSDGKWYFPKAEASSSSSSSSSSYYYSYSTNSQKGAVGLSNLGNTCFMNSSLQCLSNTEPLLSYFLEDKFEAELNRENPLGMKGEIAENFASLLKNIWTTESSSVSPRALKSTIGQFAPQFSGYAQHDSQELLAFLLDGLHEDLNRIKKKPYIESNEMDGRKDEEIALEAWKNHKRRNDSIVVDLFQGLLKSTVSCPKRNGENGICGKVSITFDPYMFLSLHLPIENKKDIKVTVKFQSNPKPLMVKVSVKKRSSIQKLVDEVSKIVKIPSEKLTIVEVYHSNIRMFSSYQTTSSIDEKDEIFCYENEIDENDKEKLMTHVNMFVALATESESSYYNSLEKFGIPMRVTAPRDCSYSELHNIICESLLKHGYLQESQLEGIKKSEIFTIRKSSYEKDIDPDRTIELTLDCTIYAVFNIEMKKTLFSEVKFEDHEEHESVKVESEESGQVSVEKCLQILREEEQLGENDKWYCPNCKEHLQAFKKVEIWSVPDILVIHFKRFSYDSYTRDKIDNYIDFPLKDLDLSNYICGTIEPDKSYKYDLYAVSNHYGGLGGGHYTAFAKNKDDNQWYSFDDSSVTKVDENKVKTQAAYVLFYKRQKPSQ